MNKLLNNVDRMMLGGLILLVIFIPYSQAVIQAGLIILWVGWIIQIALEWKFNTVKASGRSINLTQVGIYWPLLIIGLLIILSFPFSHAPALTIKKFFSRYLQQVLLMFVVVKIINSAQRLGLLFCSVLLTSVVLNGDIIFQLFSGHSFIFPTHMLVKGRVTGPLGHPNDLSTLLVGLMPLIFSLAILPRGQFFIDNKIAPCRLVKILSFTVFYLMIFALGLTASRGAWAAFAITMISFSLFLKRRRMLIMFLCILLVFFLFFGLRCINLRTDVFKKSDNIQELYSKTSDRFVYWRTALEVFKTSPIYGCGYNAYVQTLKDLKVGHEEYPHNSILHILAELGVIGLVAYLWFFIQLFTTKARQVFKVISCNQNLFMVGCGVYFSLMGWVIHSFMDTAWGSLQLTMLWWMMVGLFLSLPAVAQSMSLKER